MNDNNSITKGIYRHYKGALYQVTGIAVHSENLQEMVIYQSIETGQFWCRPLNMFFQDVTSETGERVTRFEFLRKI